MSPAGTGSKWYREPILKWLLIYLASPFVAVVMVAVVFFPYLGLLIALVVGTIATLRNNRAAKTAMPRDHRA